MLFSNIITLTKVFNASLGVLGTQEKYVTLILLGFNLREGP